MKIPARFPMSVDNPQKRTPQLTGLNGWRRGFEKRFKKIRA